MSKYVYRKWGRLEAFLEHEPEGRKLYSLMVSKSSLEVWFGKWYLALCVA